MPITRVCSQNRPPRADQPSRRGVFTIAPPPSCHHLPQFIRQARQKRPRCSIHASESASRPRYQPSPSSTKPGHRNRAARDAGKPSPGRCPGARISAPPSAPMPNHTVTRRLQSPVTRIGLAARGRKSQKNARCFNSTSAPPPRQYSRSRRRPPGPSHHHAAIHIPVAMAICSGTNTASIPCLTSSVCAANPFFKAPCYRR